MLELFVHNSILSRLTLGVDFSYLFEVKNDFSQDSFHVTKHFCFSKHGDEVIAIMVVLSTERNLVFSHEIITGDGRSIKQR